MQKRAPLAIQAHGGTYSALSGSHHETLEVVYELEGCTLTWSQTANEMHEGKRTGTIFHGTEGSLVVDRESYLVSGAKERIPPFYSPRHDFYTSVQEHHDNFLECIRTRAMPNADCETGHRSTSVCLLGNIAADLKRRLVWDAGSERFIGDEQADRFLFRPYRAPWRL
jgi:predicted dehydrogenase